MWISPGGKISPDENVSSRIHLFHQIVDPAVFPRVRTTKSKSLQSSSSNAGTLSSWWLVNYCPWLWLLLQQPWLETNQPASAVLGADGRTKQGFSFPLHSRLEPESPFSPRGPCSLEARDLEHKLSGRSEALTTQWYQPAKPRSELRQH